jgi:hypothetical protein
MLICTHLWNRNKLLTEQIDSLSPHRETADCLGILYIRTCLLAPRHYREVGSLEIHGEVVFSHYCGFHLCSHLFKEETSHSSRRLCGTNPFKKVLGKPKISLLFRKEGFLYLLQNT